jgi:nitrite reductase (NADH) large subunit
VIGNGMVGVRLLEDLLARAPDRYAITVFGAEPVPAYNRIALSKVLSGSRDAGEIALQPASWYARHGIDLRVGVTVTATDRAARLISTADGSAVPYDVLVMATGSRPFAPPLPGREKEGVFAFRTLDDCAAITSHAQRCRMATVLGGSLPHLQNLCGDRFLPLRRRRLNGVGPQVAHRDGARGLARRDLAGDAHVRLWRRSGRRVGAEPGGGGRHMRRRAG